MFSVQVGLPLHIFQIMGVNMEHKRTVLLDCFVGSTTEKNAGGIVVQCNMGPEKESVWRGRL
jgi:hypothetical protein